MNKQKPNEEKRKTNPRTKEFKIQHLIEKTPKKYGIPLDASAYYTILTDQDNNDIIVWKQGDKINLGFMNYFLGMAGNLDLDIVMTFDYNNGIWMPLEIENSILEKEDLNEETFEDWITIFKPWLDEGKLKYGAFLDPNGEDIHIKNLQHRKRAVLTYSKSI